MGWDITQETAKIIMFILLAIYALICTPLSMYFAHKLWQLNKANIPYITKRRPKIVICHVITFNINALIVRPVADFRKVYDPDAYSYIRQLAQYLLIFICVRLWLLYYDYNFELQTLDEKWEQEITNKQNGKKWTKKYRWLGNPKIMSLIAFTFASCVILVVFILPRKYSSYTQPVVVLYVVFIVIMVIQIRVCRDQFYIRKEFLVIMLTFLAYLVVYAAFIVPFTAVGSMSRLVVMNFCVSSGSYIACFISTYWIMKQYQKQKAHDEQSQSESRLKLEDIISKKDGFDLFAIYLVKEFAIENLAFIFEVMQIKSEAIRSKLIDETQAGYIVPIVAERIEKVKGNQCRVNGINSLKKRAKYILDEYVNQAAHHCINVSSFTRTGVLEKFNELAHQEVKDSIGNLVERNLHEFTGTAAVNEEHLKLTLQYITMFDKALNEISGLMKRDSLTRFYYSEEYKAMSSK